MAEVKMVKQEIKEIKEDNFIDNLPNHLIDKKDYLLKLKDSIDIPIACIKCRKYGHHISECGKTEKAKKEKDKKEKTKKKQDGVDIKSVTIQDLMTEAKIVKQEIKEDNSTEIDETKYCRNNKFKRIF